MTRWKEPVSPKMLDAGIVAHAKWSETLGGVGDLCIAIYRAMCKAKPDCFGCSDPWCPTCSRKAKP